MKWISNANYVSLLKQNATKGMLTAFSCYFILKNEMKDNSKYTSLHINCLDDGLM